MAVYLHRLKLYSVLVIFSLATSGLLGQTDRAGLIGRVSDAGGALVPGAEVVVRNLETGPAFSTVTMDDGRYVVPRILRPGTYVVEASLPGFKRAVSEPVVLSIGDEKTVDIVLELGEITETVTVISESALLETNTSSVGEVIEGREINELPLKDRNFTQLATLSPGVNRALVGVLTDATFFNQGDPRAGSVPGGSNPQGSSEAARFSRSGGASISANGLRPTQNNFSLDGVDNNEPQFGTIGVFPNPDAIQEFKVETSVPKAEVGRGGAVINTTFKSGTNSYHGSVFYYGQNSALNATHSIINKRGLEKSSTRVNEFGFTFGGPIAEDHTFFFVDYLGQRNAFPFPFQTVVPTAKSRIGDFSEFSDPVIDPLTGEAFPGNVVPSLQSRADFSPAAFNLINAFPLPTRDVLNPGFGNPNFFGLRNNEENIDSFDVKVDHRLGDSNNLMGRVSFSDQQRIRDNFFEGLPTAGFGAGEEVGDTRQVVISDTHVFNPSLINEFRFGFTRIRIGINNAGVDGALGVNPNFCADIGIPNCNKGTVETTGGILTGGFGTGEFEFTGDGGLFRVQSDNFYVSDAFSLIRGNHTWKFGFEARPRFLDTIDGGRSGGLKGHLQWQVPFSAGSTGNVQADYLLSVPATFAASGTVGGNESFEIDQTEWALYIQDDWKVRPNLTLNLGLRYDLFGTPEEASDRQANFVPGVNQIFIGSDLLEQDTNNFGPRTGFAWAFAEGRKMVLRGGYGLLYALDGVDYPPLIRNPPATASVAIFEGDEDRTGFTLDTGPPQAVPEIPPNITPASSLFFLQPELQAADIHQWNLLFQWEFRPNWLMDVGYVGNRATHLLATRQLGNNDAGLGLARTSAGEPIGSVVGYEPRGSSSYHGLQAKLQKRLSHGVEFRSSYAWSHTIDDNLGVFGGIGRTEQNANGPTNPLDPGNEKASSTLDIRHQFSTNLIWDLPWGRGRRFLTDLDGFANQLLGGWQANFIFSGTTGQPFDVQIDSPNGRVRPSLVGDPEANVPANKVINPNAFSFDLLSVTNLAGKEIFFGNFGRNVLRGPGYFRTDFSLFKHFFVNEDVTVQFGMEFFNFFNHNDPVIPNNFLGRDGNIEGNFGEFDNALAARQIQYRLKILF